MVNFVGDPASIHFRKEAWQQHITALRLCGIRTWTTEADEDITVAEPDLAADWYTLLSMSAPFIFRILPQQQQQNQKKKKKR